MVVVTMTKLTKVTKITKVTTKEREKELTENAKETSIFVTINIYVVKLQMCHYYSLLYSIVSGVHMMLLRTKCGIVPFLFKL